MLTELECEADEFQCEDNECIPLDRKCDGRRDCNNGLDEYDCPVINPPCPAGSHRCSDGTCIHQSKVCNGYQDCRDGSDEQSCGKFYVLLKFVLCDYLITATHSSCVCWRV